MNEQPTTNFFDKNTLLAILLSFLVFFGWQQYMQKKYPDLANEEKETQSTAQKASGEQDQSSVKQNETTETATATEIKSATPSPETAPAVVFQSKDVQFRISSQGMAILDLELKEYNRRTGGPIVYHLPLQSIAIDGQKQFSIEQTGPQQFVGTQTNGSQKTSVIYEVLPEQYLLKTKVIVENNEKKNTQVTVHSQFEVFPIIKSFLLPPTDHQEIFTEVHGKISRDKLNPEATLNKKSEQVSIAALNTQYFAYALLNQSSLTPSLNADSKGTVADLQLVYSTVEPQQKFEASYSTYFGPKKRQILSSVDESLVDMIDYGMFGFIGRPMHAALVMIHKMVGNWGLAIIVITLLLRTLILPVGVYSFRSMKKMQKIQPKLQAIKEKYKNDAQKANQETLLLLRSEKANPLSGCIPALMQLPIFVAFFSMMNSSFELYMQPFYFWIHDLSSKDPFYVFPILAGAAMFFQMRLTPTTTTDPAQAKIMSMMPLLFTVFMLSTPSGLALYMFIGSLFSIFQQLIFMKEKTT